jgi:hypothetical protein
MKFSLMILTQAAALCVHSQPTVADMKLLKKAQAIHKSVITIDTHIDINVANFTDERNYTQRLSNQVNLPKMEEGGMDVAWLIAYAAKGPLTEEGYAKAYSHAVAKFDAIHRLTKVYAPEKIALALNSADVRRIVHSGKMVAMIGVENGYSIGTDLRRVKEFTDRGARFRHRWPRPAGRPAAIRPAIGGLAGNTGAPSF